MDNQVREVATDENDSLDSARASLTVEAVAYILRDQMPNSGVGTVSVNDKGAQEIKGVNSNLSTINWQESLSRTLGISDPHQVHDKNTFDADDGKLKHAYVQHDYNKAQGTDEIRLVGMDGRPIVDMKGVCGSLEIENDQKKSECLYTLNSELGNGTVKIENSSLDNYTSRSTITVTSDKSAGGSVDMTFRKGASGDLASYEYKKK